MSRILLRAPKSPFEVRSPQATLAGNLVASNSGNLVFIDAAWKLLAAPGVEITPDRLVTNPGRAARINERFDHYVIPLANAFRLSYVDRLEQLTSVIQKLRIPVTVLGVGAQGTIDYRWDALAPIEPAVKRFVAAVLDHAPTIGVRGEGTRDYLVGLGFSATDIEVIGCPSTFFWGEDLRVERKVEALDATSRISITISPYRTQMGAIAMSTLARYPELTYVAQDVETLALLLDGTPLEGGTPRSMVPLHPAHPFFAQDRARYYVDPWPWIEDLRSMDFSFGTRIHGSIAAVLAGTPAMVLAHDSRTLELARYFDIPHRLLRDVPADIDAADLYAEADFTAFHAGHAARMEVFTGFLATHGLDHAFAHPGAAEAFDRRIASIRFPGAVTVRDRAGSLDPRRMARLARTRVRELARSDAGRRFRRRLPLRA